MSDNILEPVDTDHAERAQALRISGTTRIHLNKIGFWPGNRSGMGILPYHVHEVANDIVCTGTRIDRYNSVGIVKIPPSPALRNP